MVGDPHVKNILGETFDLKRPGVHVLLNIPRSSSADSALLRVEGLVASQGVEDCAAGYVKALSIYGEWLGSTSMLKFVAPLGLAENPGASRDNAPIDLASGYGLSVGNSSSLSVAEFVALVPPAMVQMRLPSQELAPPMLANRHATGMTASLRIGPGVSMKISWVAERTSAMLLEGSLWISVSGLKWVAGPIGGLLGLDEHHGLGLDDKQNASTWAPDCVKSSLLSVHPCIAARATLED